MMEKAHALVNVRDINLLCQHYKTYAQIEGQARRRKITRARRRKGVLEVRTAARCEWVQPVAWIEWINDLGVTIRYMARSLTVPAWLARASESERGPSSCPHA